MRSDSAAAATPSDPLTILGPARTILAMRPPALLAPLLATLASCVAPLRATAPIAAELESWPGASSTSHPETFRSILRNSLTVDSYVCTPSPREVFLGPVVPGARTIHGTMPHYGLYDGPMRYHVERSGDRWRVSLRIALRPPPRDAVLELPDCSLRASLEGPVECTGVPFHQAHGVDACPDSGTFRARATPRNVAALLEQWSSEAERYWNRDASRFGIPVQYDFDFVEAPEGQWVDADATLPLQPTCGRTPYFKSLRAGWSLPVLAHEVGHWLGLLDEYEMFSGIVGFYPKTPFPGAELSRMGLSMKAHTLVLPLHHYLVLRRYFCPEPESRDPYDPISR